MSTIYEIPRCQHVRVNGVQCNSPAMGRQRFCYYHYHWRQASSPKSGSRGKSGGDAGQRTALALPPLEDANSIQMALMQIMRLILSQQIDAKMAGLLLYALQTASANLKHLTLEPDWKTVVVNPAAVRYSPLEVSSDAPIDLEKENELLYERLQKGPDVSIQSPAATSPESGVGDQEPVARSQEPVARSQEPVASSQESGVGSQESGVGRQESGVADPAAAKPSPVSSGKYEEKSGARAGAKKKPCATVGAAVQAVLRSRHPLPTCPEDWEELKMADTTAWLLSFTSLLYPREEWERVKDDPEKFKDLSAPRVDRSSQ